MKILRKDQTPIAFKAQANDGALTLDIFDVIGADFFGQGITASMVNDALKGEPYNSITLNINSPGGDLFEGVAVYNLLKASGKQVNVNVVGLAASAASLVAMAGDTVTMCPGTQMMIHEAMACTAGFADDMRKMADVLDSVTASAADLYVAKTGMTKDAVLKMMAEETWMGPEDALKNGFATALGKGNAVQNSFDLSLFKNTPIELQAKTKRVANEDLTAACFIYVGDPDKVNTWSLPWHFSTEEKTQSHLRDALARFDQDTIIPEAHKAECYAKLVRLAKEHGIEVSKKAQSKVIVNASDPDNDGDDDQPLMDCLQQAIDSCNDTSAAASAALSEVTNGDTEDGDPALENFVKEAKAAITDLTDAIKEATDEVNEPVTAVSDYSIRLKRIELEKRR